MTTANAARQDTSPDGRPSETSLEKTAIVLFFAVVFFYFSHPLADGDLWWHLNTGRWIVTHRALPENDPFTHTLSPAYAERAHMFVRSNWLAQASYYLIYQLAGFGGLRFFNAALFTLTLSVVYRTQRLHGVGVWWALLLASPCAAILWYYDELRPMGFSILLTALFVYLIESAARKPDRANVALALLTPLAMLWANVHRGFPAMYLVLVPYTAVWLWRRRYRAGLWLIAAVCASLANPGGIAPAVSAIEESFQGTGSLQIMELARPWELARIAPDAQSYLPLLAIIGSLSLTLMAVEWRALRSEHVLVYAVYAVAGLTAFRYSAYLVVVALAMCAPYAARALHRGRAPTSRWVPRLGVAAASGALLWSSAPLTRQSVYAQGLPTQAVARMSELRLPGPLLNPLNWGGYIAWAAGPEYKVFIDSRLLDFSVYRKLQDALRGPAAPLLREYGINTVLYPPVDLQSLRSERLVLELMADRDWQLVYFDTKAALFSRRSAVRDAPSASQQSLGAYMLSAIAYRTRKRPFVAQDHFETAAILLAMGRPQEAREAQARGSALLQPRRLAPDAARP